MSFPVVSFINVLRKYFSYKNLAPKRTELCFRQNVARKKLCKAHSYKKRTRKTLMKLIPVRRVSEKSDIYSFLFRPEWNLKPQRMVNNKLFTLLWPTNEGVNFTNIYEQLFYIKEFYVLIVWVFIFVKGNQQKIASKMLVKLTSGDDFNQYFWAKFLKQFSTALMYQQ